MIDLHRDYIAEEHEPLTVGEKLMVGACVAIGSGLYGVLAWFAIEALRHA